MSFLKVYKNQNGMPSQEVASACILMFWLRVGKCFRKRNDAVSMCVSIFQKVPVKNVSVMCFCSCSTEMGFCVNSVPCTSSFLKRVCFVKKVQNISEKNKLVQNRSLCHYCSLPSKRSACYLKNILIKNLFLEILLFVCLFFWILKTCFWLQDLAHLTNIPIRLEQPYSTFLFHGLHLSCKRTKKHELK